MSVKMHSSCSDSSSANEKAIFEKLISVSGIGPKLAITVLSGLATPDLVAAVRGGDVPRLVRIPGVGKKPAERIILELKDKMAAMAVGDSKSTTPAAPSLSALDQDVLSALVNLGCSATAAEEAIRKAHDKNVEERFEPLFRAALALDGENRDQRSAVSDEQSALSPAWLFSVKLIGVRAVADTGL